MITEATTKSTDKYCNVAKITITAITIFRMQ